MYTFSQMLLQIGTIALLRYNIQWFFKFLLPQCFVPNSINSLWRRLLTIQPKIFKSWTFFFFSFFFLKRVNYLSLLLNIFHHKNPLHCPAIQKYAFETALKKMAWKKQNKRFYVNSIAFRYFYLENAILKRRRKKSFLKPKMTLESEKTVFVLPKKAKTKIHSVINGT